MKSKTTIEGNIKEIKKLCKKYGSKFRVILENEDLLRLKNALHNIDGEGTMEELLEEDDLGLNEIYKKGIPTRVKQGLTVQVKNYVNKKDVGIKYNYRKGTTICFFLDDSPISKEESGN